MTKELILTLIEFNGDNIKEKGFTKGVIYNEVDKN